MNTLLKKSTYCEHGTGVWYREVKLGVIKRVLMQQQCYENKETWDEQTAWITWVIAHVITGNDECHREMKKVNDNLFYLVMYSLI